MRSEQYAEALEFCRAQPPSSGVSFNYTVLACHAALGSGEISYATMWAQQWVKANPTHIEGLRLYYAALLEEEDSERALEVLQELLKVEPEAPERLDLVRHLAEKQKYQKALDLLSSAPTIDLSTALMGHEITLAANAGGEALETEWLRKAERIDARDQRVILARYRVSPTLEQAVAAITKLKLRPDAAHEFETVQVALRIIAAHPELKPDSWLASLQELEPSTAAAYPLELALLWERFGRDDKALEHLRTVLNSNPTNEIAALSLSRLYLRNDRAEDALNVLTPIPRTQLFESELLVKQLVETAIALTRYEIALAAQQVLIKHRPNSPEEKIRLAQLYNFNGLYEEELGLYEECLEYEESRLTSTLLRTFSTPRIYESETQLKTVRKRIIQHLPDFQDAARQYLDGQCEVLHRVLADHTNFTIGYQQYNDIEIQRTFGDVLHSVNSNLVPALPQRKRDSVKPQVAFYTHFTWNHTVGKLFHRWMTGLSELGYDVAVISNNKTSDHVTERIKESVSCFEVCEPSLQGSVQTVRALSPDVLIFPEIGMGPLALGTAATRNAPIQCMAWGHPITSGLPTMDYFLSSELMEPADAQQHYTEELIELPGLSIEYEAPALPEVPYTRSQLGLPEGRILLLSCQTLYKLLPRYDEAYIEILSAVPEADLVFLANRSRYVTEQFRQRLEARMKQRDVATSRLHIIGPLPHDAYLSLNLVSDVFLDAHGWSGGNTTLEALRTNLPIVTTPGEFMRGRHTAAILTQIGLEDFVAKSNDEWIQRAINYAKDEALRADHAHQIKESSQLAYRHPATIQALANKLTRLYQQRHI